MKEQIGRIIRGLGGLYTVHLSDGGGEVSCRARGVFRHEKISPEVGDRVRVKRENDTDAVIDEILERRSLLTRPPVANLDLLFIVAAVRTPELSLLAMDKLISVAAYHHIEPAVIVTKADLDPARAEEVAALYRTCGYEAFVCGTDRDPTELRAYLEQKAAGRICAFAGPSGVGKSTLLNVLFPELSLETGAVSEKTARGRHTTRRVELYPLSSPDSWLADTPGFGLLDFVHFDYYTKEDLPFLFREFEPYLTRCRYTKCTHTKEEGCAVLEAVREGSIPRERHESFLAIYEELKNKHPWH